MRGDTPGRISSPKSLRRTVHAGCTSAHRSTRGPERCCFRNGMAEQARAQRGITSARRVRTGLRNPSAVVPWREEASLEYISFKASPKQILHGLTSDAIVPGLLSMRGTYRLLRLRPHTTKQRVAGNAIPAVVQRRSRSAKSVPIVSMYMPCHCETDLVLYALLTLEADARDSGDKCLFHGHYLKYTRPVAATSVVHTRGHAATGRLCRPLP